MIEDITQFLIAFLSGLSIFFLAGKRYRHLGFIVGLVGQPLWIWTAYVSEQWGIFAVALWWSAQYIRGLRNCRSLKSYETDGKKRNGGR